MTWPALADIVWYTNQIKPSNVDDKRQHIIGCALAELGESGFAAFSQLRVAKRAGLRQSHLTYYFPTRLDLLIAVAETAMDRQIASLDGLLAQSQPGQGAASIALLLGRKENARVLLALVQGADQEPRLKTLFDDLATRMRQRAGVMLARIHGEPVPAVHHFLLHALCVGLAVLGLALDDTEAGDARKVDVIDAAIQMMQHPQH